MSYRRYFELNVAGVIHFRELIQEEAEYTMHYGTLQGKERRVPGALPT